METASLIRLACVLEAATPKPGNVHPGSSFDDTAYRDFVRSAEVIAPVLAETPRLGVGAAVLEAVTSTRQAVGTNTNLGIVLLLAPLAAVPCGMTLPEGIGRVLDGLTQSDASLVYRAIRIAEPGGLGEASEQDVAEEPTVTLLEAMRLAAERDAIAAEYATGFAVTLGTGVRILSRHDDFTGRWWEAILDLQLVLMAERGDTLIARKCGNAIASESAHRARTVLGAGGAATLEGRARLRKFDRWLRADGNRRNPGATADLVCASLFAAIRDGRVVPPKVDEEFPLKAHAYR